jgi:hypothetical protein
VWLPSPDGLSAFGPYPLLAKVARSDPPGAPVPVLLGLEFFLAHGASLGLPPHPTSGMIGLP